jgi:P27 family predicted phage terminase small subunit
MWKRVVEGLKDRSGIAALHADSLERACKMADEIDLLERDIAKHGWTDSNQNGIEYLRPQVKQYNTARRMMQFYEKEFGLTTAADERLRGAPVPEEDEDPLDALRSQRFGVTG